LSWLWKMKLGQDNSTCPAPGAIWNRLRASWKCWQAELVSQSSFHL